MIYLTKAEWSVAGRAISRLPESFPVPDAMRAALIAAAGIGVADIYGNEEELNPNSAMLGLIKRLSEKK